MSRAAPLQDRRPRTSSFEPSSVAAGGAEALAFRVVEATAGVMLVILTARLMGPAGRGLFALTSFVTLLVSLPLGAIWSANAIEIAHRRTSPPELFGAALVIAGIGGIATGLLAAVAIPFAGESWWVVGFPAMAAPYILLSRYEEGFFQALGHVRAVNWMTLGRMVLPLMLISIPLGLDAADVTAVGDKTAIGFWILGLVLLAVVAFDPSRHLMGGIVIPRTRELYARLLRTGGWLGAANSAVLLNTRLALLGLALFSTTAEVGVYSVAVAAAEMLQLTTFSLVSAAFRQIGSGNRERAVEVTVRAVRHVMLLDVLASAILIPIVFATLSWVVGDGYEQVPELLLVIAPGIVAYSGFLALQTFFTVHLARPRIVVRISLLTLAGNFLLVFALVPVLGIWGAAIAATASGFLGAAVSMRRFRVETGVSLSAFRPGRAELLDYAKLLGSLGRTLRRRVRLA